MHVTKKTFHNSLLQYQCYVKLEYGPMPNVMAILSNIGVALYSMPQSLADARCWSAMQ